MEWLYLCTMRFLLIFSSFVVLSLQAVADPYLLFREKDKIGIKDDAGKVLIPAAFDALGWSDGTFSVVSGVTGYKLNDHWGLINLKKEFLSKAEYEHLTWSGADRIIVQKKINAVKSATGCLDLRGKRVVPFLYDGIKINGLRGVAFVRQKSGYRYGLIDLNGQVLIPLNYLSIQSLGTLRYAVENDARKTALYDDSGKAITDFSIDSISNFRNGYAVLYQHQLQGLVNRDGEITTPSVYRDIQYVSGGIFEGRMPDEWKVLDGNNHELRKTDADQLIPLTPELYHITRKQLHGIVDHDFKIILPIAYNYLGTLKENKIIAEKGSKYGLIRKDGSVVIPFDYDSILLEGRLARVRKDIPGRSSWMVVDTFGITKTEKEFDYIGAFNGSFFPVRKNGFWGMLDRYGKESVGCVYDSLLGFSGDQVAVGFMGQYGIITTGEKWIVSPQASKLTPVQGDCYWLKTDSTIFLRGLTGNDIYFTRNRISFGADYMVETSPDGSVKHVDYMGRIVERSAPVLVSQPEKVYPESEGLRGILKDGKYGFVDERGRLRIANRYDGIGPFREGLAAVKIISRWGYINKIEKIVVQPVYDGAGDFSRGRALVRKNGKFGLIDNDGRQVIPVRYDSIVAVSPELYRVLSEKYYGICNRDGRILADTKFDDVEDLNNGFFLIQRDGKSGLLTGDGLSTIPLLYDQLIYDRSRNEYLGLMKSSWRKLKF